MGSLPLANKPGWLRQRAPQGERYDYLSGSLRSLSLHTVCEEAQCPNVGECWSQGHATMMIMGEICTRGCTFCNVATGRPDSLDAFEPGRVADAGHKLGLAHVVVTSVDRDDLADGGAEHFARTIRAIRHRSPATTIEVLVPDFLRCGPDALEVVVASPASESAATELMVIARDVCAGWAGNRCNKMDWRVELAELS